MSLMKRMVDRDSYTDFSNLVDKEQLQKDIDAVEKQKGFVTWVMSFTKKTVTILFGLYILVTLVTLVLMFISYQIAGQPMSIDTLIVENNETFRVVIGGYLIKAGVENGLKIGMNYYLGIVDLKLKQLRSQYDVGEGSTDETDNDCQDTYEETDPSYDESSDEDDTYQNRRDS